MEKSGVPGTFHPTSGTRREVYGNASTYLAKIAVALHDAPDQMLTFTQLIQKMEPLISEGRKSVENNIRVCLSTHRCFRKIPVVPDPVTTKRNYWKLDSSQITTKMVRRHLKDLLHLFPELASKVETGSKNQRSGKQSVLCSPQPAACDDARVNGKFSSSFSIENLLKKDTTPARPLRAFPPSILLVKAEQHLCSDHRSAGEKTHLLALLPSLCGPAHPKPSRLSSGPVTVEARSSVQPPHHSPSWSNSPYTAWRCV
uniref:Fork-head domain-containing protein n=1 Tax=Oryzias latipes TaxID=8090 RepID=A0A3B3H2H5_ORYLA